MDPVERVHDVVHQGPVLRRRSGFGVLIRAWRGLIFRLMRPFVAYQQQINVATVEAVEHLQAVNDARAVDLALALAHIRTLEEQVAEYETRYWREDV